LRPAHFFSNELSFTTQTGFHQKQSHKKQGQDVFYNEDHLAQNRAGITFF
jgi:hypothetical protein